MEVDIGITDPTKGNVVEMFSAVNGDKKQKVIVCGNESIEVIEGRDGVIERLFLDDADTHHDAL